MFVCTEIGLYREILGMFGANLSPMHRGLFVFIYQRLLLCRCRGVEQVQSV